MEVVRLIITIVLVVATPIVVRTALKIPPVGVVLVAIVIAVGVAVVAAPQK